MSRMVSLFGEAATLGCFAPDPGAGARVLELGVQQTGNTYRGAWRLELPPMDGDALDVLLRLVAAQGSTSVLRHFSLVESADPALDRIDWTNLGELKAPDVSFVVENHMRGTEEKHLPILLTFAGDASKALVAQTIALFRAWGKLLQFGALPSGPALPASCGILEDVGGHTSEEVVANVYSFGGSRDVWAPLLFGLLERAQTLPIVRLEIG